MSKIDPRRECVVCSKKYKTCKTCEELAHKGTFAWRASCDTQECFSVMLILNGYFYKEYTKSEARELLEMYLTEEMKPYTENTRHIIEEIFAEEPVIILSSSSANLDQVGQIEEFCSSDVNEEDSSSIIDTYESLYED